MPAFYRSYYTFTFGDKNGDEATMRLRNWTNDAALVSDAVAASGALGAAIGAPGVISNAKVIRRGWTVLFDEAQLSAGTPPLDAEFPSVVDKAVLGFASAEGFASRVAIPAPIEAMFHAPPSDANVDPSVGAVATLIGALEAILQGAPGVALNLYTGGTRQGSRARRLRGRGV